MSLVQKCIVIYTHRIVIESVSLLSSGAVLAESHSIAQRSRMSVPENNIGNQSLLSRYTSETGSQTWVIMTQLKSDAYLTEHSINSSICFRVLYNHAQTFTVHLKLRLYELQKWMIDTILSLVVSILIQIKQYIFCISFLRHCTSSWNDFRGIPGYFIFIFFYYLSTENSCTLLVLMSSSPLSCRIREVSGFCTVWTLQSRL